MALIVLLRHHFITRRPMQLNDLIHRQQLRWKACSFVIVLLLLLASFFALSVGELWILPWAPSGDLEAQLLYQLRFPRLLAALMIGAALASSGAVLQVLLGNPLAEPGVLGISGGASLALVLLLFFCSRRSYSQHDDECRYVWGTDIHLDFSWAVAWWSGVNSEVIIDRGCTRYSIGRSGDLGVLLQYRPEFTSAHVLADGQRWRSKLVTIVDWYARRASITLVVHSRKTTRCINAWRGTCETARFRCS